MAMKQYKNQIGILILLILLLSIRSIYENILFTINNKLINYLVEGIGLNRIKTFDSGSLPPIYLLHFITSISFSCLFIVNRPHFSFDTCSSWAHL